MNEQGSPIELISNIPTELGPLLGQLKAMLGAGAAQGATQYTGPFAAQTDPAKLMGMNMLTNAAGYGNYRQPSPLTWPQTPTGAYKGGPIQPPEDGDGDGGGGGGDGLPEGTSKYSKCRKLDPTLGKVFFDCMRGLEPPTSGIFPTASSTNYNPFNPTRT